LKKLLWMALLLMFCWASPLVAQEAAEDIKFSEFQKILDTQCSKCHTRTRIEAAMAQGKDLKPIAEKMTKHGARLSDRERDVMGVYWMENSPAPKTLAVPPPKDDPLAEYRAVLQARCTGCHSLDRIEQAMNESRSFETLAKMMLDRGAVLSEADHKVIGVFWGESPR